MANQEANLEKIDAVFLTKTTLQPDSAIFDKWTLKEFWVKEDIGRPYHGTVDIVSKYKSIDFSKLLGKSCVLKIFRGADRERLFKGIVSRVELLGMQQGRSAVKINFAPALHALEYGKNTRIFADKTAPQIIEEVVKEALAPFDRQIKMQVLRKYAVREYTVQYNESDFNFVSRLMVDEGITCYFDQSTEHETLVMVDSNEGHVEIVTMKGNEVIISPVPEVVNKLGTVRIKVVEDESNDPVPGVLVRLQLPDGMRRVLTTDREGVVELSNVIPGNCEAGSVVNGKRVEELLEFVGEGESPIQKGAQKKAKGTKSKPVPWPAEMAIGSVKEYKVKTGDTMASLARDAEMTIAQLAYFNWGVYSPAEIQKCLRDQVGCTKKDGQNRYLFDDTDQPGIMRVPKPWTLEQVMINRPRTVRVRLIDRPLPDFIFDCQIDAEAPENQNDVFILTTVDGSWKHEVKVGDLKEYAPDMVRMVFPAPPTGQVFHLLHDPGDGEPPFYFHKDVSYGDLLDIREKREQTEAEEDARFAEHEKEKQENGAAEKEDSGSDDEQDAGTDDEQDAGSDENT